MGTYHSISDGRIFSGTAEGDYIRDIATGHLYPRHAIVPLSQPSPPVENPLIVFLWILFFIFLIGPGVLAIWLAMRVFKVDWREAARAFVGIAMLLGMVQIVGLFFDWKGPWNLAVWYYDNLVVPFWSIVVRVIEIVF